MRMCQLKVLSAPCWRWRRPRRGIAAIGEVGTVHAVCSNAVCSMQPAVVELSRCWTTMRTDQPHYTNTNQQQNTLCMSLRHTITTFHSIPFHSMLQLFTPLSALL